MKKDDVLAAVIASAKADGSWTATYTEQQIANACWAAEISDIKYQSLLIALQEDAEPVYSKPAQRSWVGLTDEERDEILDSYLTAEGRARAIEAKLKEKNT